MQTVPFWTAHVSRPPLPAVADLPVWVDTAVVGAGFTGLSAALTLLKHGASVAVLDKQQVGFGASGRSGGLATTGLRQPVEVIFRRYGDAVGHVLWQASVEAIDHIGELVVDEALDCDFQRKGHVQLAVKGQHFKRMAERVDWYRYHLGHRMELVEAVDMRREVGSGVFYGGLIDELSGSLNPAKLVYGLASAVVERGGALCESTAVTRIQPSSGGFRLTTSQGDLLAREVIMATNGTAGRIVPALRRRVFPARKVVIVTEPLPLAWQREISPKGRVFVDSHNRPHYFRLTPDGRLLWAGMPAWRSRHDLNDAAYALASRMHLVFPDLRAARLAYGWSGWAGMTLDWLPHMGTVGGVHYAAGYSGQGVATAVYLGRELARQVCSGQTRSIFAELRHLGVVGGRRPWFLPLVDWYHRAWRRFC